MKPRRLNDKIARNVHRFLGLDAVPAAPGLLVEGRQLGRYRIGPVLGRGGMGVVYKAHDAELQRDVALKVLSAEATPALIERFKQEARAVARLNHPGIVRLYEVGTVEGIRFLAMELIDAGEPLDADIGRFERIARALDYAHKQGVIHRDLKPANILVDKAGEPHITDFGLARIADEDKTLTRTGVVMGTPLYMSPEQVRGDSKQVDARSDVYGLGVMLYESLTGQVPYQAETANVLYQRILNGDPERPRKLDPSLSADLETICLKAMHVERDHRYESAGALADDLRRHLAGEPIEARPSMALTRLLWKLKRRPALVTAVVATVGLAGLGLWGAGLYRRHQHDQEKARLAEDAKRDQAVRTTDFEKRMTAAGAAWFTYQKAAADAGGTPEQLASFLDRAVAAARAAVAADPGRADAQVLLAQCLKEQLHEDEALAALDAALKADPKSVAALSTRFLMLYEKFYVSRGAEMSGGGTTEPETEKSRLLREQWESDLRRMRQGLAGGDAGPPVLHLMTGLELRAAGSEREALAHFDLYLKETPGDPEALFFRGFSRLATANLQGADQDLTRALEILGRGSAGTRVGRRRVSCLLARSNVRWAMGNPKGALEDNEEAVRCEASPATLLTRAVSRLKVGNVDGAFADLEAALKFGESATIYNYRAIAYRAKKDEARAIQDATDAIRLNPSMAAPYVTRGNAYYVTDRREEAIRDFTMAIERDERLPEAHNSRGVVYRVTGKPDLALKDFDRAIELDPEAKQFRYNRGDLRKRMAAQAGEGSADFVPLLRLAIADYEAAGDYRNSAAEAERLRPLVDRK